MICMQSAQLPTRPMAQRAQPVLVFHGGHIFFRGPPRTTNFPQALSITFESFGSSALALIVPATTRGNLRLESGVVLQLLHALGGIESCAVNSGTEFYLFAGERLRAVLTTRHAAPQSSQRREGSARPHVS